MNTLSFEVDDSEGVGVIRIDVPGEDINRIDLRSISEMEGILNRIEDVEEIVDGEKEIRAVVIISGKEGDFISGFNLRGLLNIPSSDKARSLSLKVQEVLNRIEKSRVPFVASIHGACLGIGLEIALSCTYRVATDDKRTVFGLPEVQLGLIPFGGGTQRLPRLVGIREGLHMILTGEGKSPKRALEIGLIDEVVPREILLDISKKRAVQILERSLKPKRSGIRTLRGYFFERNPIARKALFKRIRKGVMRGANGNYLVPLMALEAVEIGMNASFGRGLHVESVYFSELVVSDASRQLINLSLAEYDIKRDPVIQNREIKPQNIEKIGVVGGGPLGAGIASISAEIGVRVRLKERDTKGAGEVLKACYDHFDKRRRRGEITSLEMGKMLDLISATSDYTGFRRAGMVIEVMPEDLEIKRRVLKEIESVTGEESVLASNTSTIPLAQIAGHARRPGNVIGIHFLPPVHKNPILEVVVTRETSEKTVATALLLARRFGKTPIVVRDGVGFYTTRILIPYLNEAINLLGEGASVEGIDEAMVEFGFSMGPLTLIDEIGIELHAKAAGIAYEAFGERLRPPQHINSLIQEGITGRGGKKGSYDYNGKKRIDESIYKPFPIRGGGEKEPLKERIQERVSLAMINEAVLCLEEGIIRNPRDGDIGAVLGLGFPAFLGGPFRYVDSLGVGRVLKRLDALASRLGPRFTPASLLLDLDRQGKKFYIE
ncbi:MAG TPA: 3-hydroxyacyl-CoA dehydrogenase NAD-binding domain-containing protein [Thermodesulfobacteriota bacterium]|nr:3-hydroxyacyl-CoA dehydrogenase NAD-binding domain-containing protein [Thermodesulfobacteriota bacterium]